VEEHDDSLLGRRLSDGDCSVLDCILRAYGPRVGGWLRHKYAGRFGSQEIRDILAMALHKLWQERDRYDPAKASLRGYFFLIARCAAVDAIRQGRHSSHGREILLGDRADRIAARERAPSEDADLEADAERSQQVKDLSDCLDKLNESSRYIILADARSNDGVVASEILARELSMSESAVRVARKRGLDRLREAMGKLGY
jgi:RNA polymerase sigma factor (sigma-70 family)